MKLVIATATAALLTATSAFAAGFEGRGPIESGNVASTTGEIVSVVMTGPASEANGAIAQGESFDVTVFETAQDKKAGGSYYR